MKTSPLAFLVFVIHLVAVTTFVGAQCDPVVDCNENGISDNCDIADYNSDDCDGDGIPDIVAGTGLSVESSRTRPEGPAEVLLAYRTQRDTARVLKD